jgi:2,5-diamino-6-(ribosylamino)-4(3H)-pyrimidinone 5'-phosphate reductase
MRRPYVICHMMGTVDGRILTERWSLPPAADRQYEAVHNLHQADAWMCGRETFQKDFLEQPRPASFARKVRVPPGDFIADAQRPSTKSGRSARPAYAIAVDSHGKLRWESNDMRGDRLIVLTSGKASSGYLADLRAKSISYLIGGKSEIDFPAALVRLRRHFGIRKLMLEGGGGLNGSLLAAGMIDEISLLVCAFADGARKLPTVFDTPEDELKKKATALRLMSARKRPGGVVWLRYLVK